MVLPLPCPRSCADPHEHHISGRDGNARPRSPLSPRTPLRTSRARAIAQLAGEAVLVTRAESPEVSQLANALLDWDVVLQVQAEVVAGRRNPAY